ncbi:MAG: hypothetical protein ABJL67_14365 [Sulfitobacter sp.]
MSTRLILQMHPSAPSIAAGSLTTKGQADDILHHAIRLALLAAIVLMAAMAWTRNINWDEFYFLSHVHAQLDGRLDRPLQTVFVHAFGWLSAVSGTEADQIAIARLVMLVFFSGTCLALHRIAATLTNAPCADIALLAFVTSGFAIAHGGSFRADPMAAGLLMGAVAIMMISRMGPFQMIAVALLSAFALLVTVKSALYLPVYIAALIWRWNDRSLVMRCLASGILALAIAAAIYVWHASGITPAEQAGTGDNLVEAASVTLGGSGFLPRWPEVSLWLMFSVGAVLLALAGLYCAPSTRLRILLVLFAAPLLSVVVYRNAFPYFFPFAVPALMVAVAFGAQALRGTLIFKLALVLMLASGVIQSQRALSEGNAAQHATLSEIHRLFPQPVPYIDQNGMLASYERLGFFMSTWGIATYRAAGQPVFADLIAQGQPPLLLANRAELYTAMRPDQANGTFLGLLEEDARVLRETYVHYAGVIWLAGLDVTLTDTSTTTSLKIAGDYRVETDGPLIVNGEHVENGDVVPFGTTPVEIQGTPGTEVRLIWNTPVTTPQKHLPETDLYAGFWRL